MIRQVWRREAPVRAPVVGLSRSCDQGRWALVDRPERMVLSVAEAAEMLGISRSLAYDLVARGELPARRLGGRIVVLLRPLQRLLDGGEPVDDAPGPSAGLDGPSGVQGRSARAS